MYGFMILEGDRVSAAVAGAFPLPQPCDRCGDDLDVHGRLVVVFSMRASTFEVVACDRQPRVWRMWARRQDNPVEGREFMYFGDEQTTRRPWLGSGVPTEVEVTEDPQGGYWGWIDFHEERGHAGVPVMVQPHEAMFRIQEPGGFVGKERRGLGEVVRLRVRAVD